jgi:hypothetical protein
MWLKIFQPNPNLTVNYSETDRMSMAYNEDIIIATKTTGTFNFLKLHTGCVALNVNKIKYYETA